MKVRTIAATGFCALALIAVSFGQTPAVRAQIDFTFSVGSKALPAGTYDFIRDDAAAAFRVTDESKNEAIAQVMTRLAVLMSGMASKASVVFDKIGDTYVLAEIWIPGEDGYALSITKGKHEHRVVNAK